MSTTPREGLKTLQPWDEWGVEVYYEADDPDMEEGWYWEFSNYTPGSNAGPDGPYENVYEALKAVINIYEMRDED
jgi:hypothetical protein